jgi:hypothetical protein
MNDKSHPQFHDEADEQPPFAGFMGMKITHVSPERVTAELLVTEKLTNRNGVLHGGALMALADNLGGTAACANLPATAARPPPLKARPISSHPFQWAMLPKPSARRCTAAAPQRSGRPALPAATASLRRW